MTICLVGIFMLEITSFCFGQRNQLLIRYDENSVFYEKHSHCEKIASGVQLTELTCVTMVRLPVFGYVKHITDKDKVSSCWRCGRGIVGVPDNFAEKQVWATAMPAQYLTMDTTVGNMIIGERINATMPSGASVEMDPDHGRVLSVNGTDSCVTADAIKDVKSISIMLWFRMTKIVITSSMFALETTIDGQPLRFRCYYMSSRIKCIARYQTDQWAIFLEAMLDQWVHLAVTWGNEEGMVVYVDGVKTGECLIPYSVKYIIRTPTFFVGCYRKENFIGLIDEVATWNEILSPEFMEAYFYHLN